MNNSCAHTGCLGVGDHAIKVCVPPEGYAIGAAAHASVIVGINLCEAHARAADKRNFLSPPIMAAMDTLARGKARPDYARAWLEPLPHASEEFGRFLRNASMGRA